MEHIRVGRVLVYGGNDVNGNAMSSIEMLSVDGRAWNTLPTNIFAADAHFASVPLMT
jgi:hypothetical protein